jgi:hypothetical protein
MTAGQQQSGHGIDWERSRPVANGYGIPETDGGMLDIEAVRERLTSAQNYWIASASKEGRPHAVPVWAAWIEDALLFGGGPRTARNLKANPWTSVHLESGTEVVIVEGPVTVVDEPGATLSQAIDDQYGAKYDWRPSSEGDEPVGKGWFRLDPVRIIAWTQFPADATRWTRVGK